MSRFLSYVLLLMAIPIATGQNPCIALNYHAFRAEVVHGTYVDLDNLGTQIFPDDLDDGNSAIHDIGFEFNFHCQSFTQFILNTNGFIKLGVETTPKDNLFFSNAQSVNGGVFSNADSNNINLIIPFNHDIEEGVGDPDFRVHTSGSAPNRVCTIQWENMREWTYEPAKQYDNMDFQVKLYETTNVIEFVYGEWDPSTETSNYKTAACGLKGLGPDDDQLLVVIKNSSAEWDNVRFKNGNYAPNEAFNFGNPPDRPKPQAGLTYRFTPTYDRDLTALQLYAAGQASAYYSTPQVISARIRNSGYETLTNIPVILETVPDGSYADTQFISSLAFGESTSVTFKGYDPGSNLSALLRLRLNADDSPSDNTLSQPQTTSDFDINYSTIGGHDHAVGYLSGVQGIHFNRYELHGEAKVEYVSVFISENAAAIGKTVFAAILNDQGQLVARSENTVLALEDLLGWKNFTFETPPVIRDGSFYAGFGMVASNEAYKALGVQNENPLRANTYYKSFITGNGLSPVDTLTSTHRYMIGVTLAPTPPVPGIVTMDQTICNGESAALELTAYTGFITWQSSDDGMDPWENESQDFNRPQYSTPPLERTTYYRAEVFQPGFAAVTSNTITVDVLAETAVVTASGDVLMSSAPEGNQWYNDDGPIVGATSALYFVTEPGTYYVVVREGDCISPPSNTVEIITVANDDPDDVSRFHVFPNPLRDQLHIVPPSETESYLVRVFNMRGQLVWNATYRGSLQLLMHTQPVGMYMVLITDPIKERLFKITKM